jgi:hypothetical protein
MLARAAAIKQCGVNPTHQVERWVDGERCERARRITNSVSLEAGLEKLPCYLGFRRTRTSRSFRSSRQVGSSGRRDRDASVSSRATRLSYSRL